MERETRTRSIFLHLLLLLLISISQYNFSPRCIDLNCCSIGLQAFPSFWLSEKNTSTWDLFILPCFSSAPSSLLQHSSGKEMATYLHQQKTKEGEWKEVIRGCLSNTLFLLIQSHWEKSYRKNKQAQRQNNWPKLWGNRGTTSNRSLKKGHATGQKKTRKKYSESDPSSPVEMSTAVACCLRLKNHKNHENLAKLTAPSLHGLRFLLDEGLLPPKQRKASTFLTFRHPRRHLPQLGKMNTGSTRMSRRCNSNCLKKLCFFNVQTVIPRLFS